MDFKFPEYKKLNLSEVNKEILDRWDENNTFEKSLTTREGKPSFIFYEGPPSANGLPGIHHVIARTIKDIFCRYKTIKGFHVKRKAGWDTHGLPVEISVEKSLNITKEDIGNKISVDDYNKACKSDVMKFTDIWEDLTRKMGYWVNMKNPYITYESKYIESVWYLLKKLFDKGLLYKGYSIQPFSPAAGTGLSTHELNMPGCYRNVKDTTGIAQFKVIRNEKSEYLFKNTDTDLFFLAWTTTPWTLLSNTALAVGGKIKYVKLRTFNTYTGIPISVIMAKDLMPSLFPEKNKELKIEDYKAGDKKIPYIIVDEYTGSEFEGMSYEQLLPYIQPTNGEAFKVLIGDFVTTEDGTGIVHLAPSFGADDYRISKKYGIGSLTLVDRKGKFVDGVGEFSGRYVKNSFENKSEKERTVDIDIVVKLKKENKLFKSEKYEHSYPHCWRTGKPVLYYPLDSWFVRTTALRDRLIELNNTINWKPKSTGSGRFGKWLENLVDWNLSRSRYWGTPLPIWVTEDRKEMICIGSFEQLKINMEKSVEAGFMKKSQLDDFVVGDYTKENYEQFDPHRPYVDEIILISENGKKMFREPDLIDVWFDSGAMPYAQLHYPFEFKENFEDYYPSDFIAEGVDQTRGWFFTLHAIAVLIFDSVAFKNIISNGLVLDSIGEKMSKSKDNRIDPFKVIEENGSDPLRWYMITNAQPWDNIKFNLNGVDEVKRKFFGTLYNTYSFFALYANVDKFSYSEKEILIENRPEIDRWIISLMHSLIAEVDMHYSNYEPTKAGRAIQHFVIENLSNWYVRLNRKRFWGGSYSENKISAYQTLFKCLETVAILASPIAPFYTDKLFTDLNNVSKHHKIDSVHLVDFPDVNKQLIDKELEQRMDVAQAISSMILGLRRKKSLKVRQPLTKIMIPALDKNLKEQIDKVKNIILTEVNVKKIEYLSDTSGILVKKIKPNFKILGKKYGKDMKAVIDAINKMSQEDIANIENDGNFTLKSDKIDTNILLSEVEILSEDIPGWLVANNNNLTVALDVTLTDELKNEGLAREFVNRIQNFRRDSGFNVTDKISLKIQKHDKINQAIEKFSNYIGTQTLSPIIELVDSLDKNSVGTKFVEIDDIKTFMKITKQ